MSASNRQHLHAQGRGRDDPTRTRTVRRTYARRLRGAFGRISAAIREGVRGDDVLGLRDDAGLDLALTADVDPPPDLATLEEAEVLRRFEEWLTGAQESEVLEVIARDENRYVRRAYERGVEDADTALRRAGYDTEDALPVEAALRLPMHEERLQQLFARNFAELEGITNEVSRQIQRELADGMAEGANPTDMARRITGRVDAIGKTRATTLARTEVIRAHAEASLNRFEEFDVDGVTVRAEWSTAGDDRVCAICQGLEGEVYTIEQARSETRRVEGSEVPIKPPAHPNCRCSLLPVGGS